MSTPRVLLIDDEPEILAILETFLEPHYQILKAEKGLQGIEIARKEHPNLILLDVMMPILNGYDVCKLLKDDLKTCAIPILFLTAKTLTKDVITGLKLGAEDYIKKPFDLEELKARIDRNLKKIPSTSFVENFGDFALHSMNRTYLSQTEQIELTDHQYKLLRTLATKKGTLVSREELLIALDLPKGSRGVDVHIATLKKKIPDLNNRLLAIYGKGYMIKD